ncbi:MAG: ATP-binding protein [Planctomycetota bacterium]
MTALRDEPDYRLCEDRPVRHTAAVQPHGCLLAFDPSLRLVAASANAASWLDRPPTLGVDLHEAIPGTLADRIAEAHARPELRPLNTTFRVALTPGVCPVHVHRNADGVLIAELLEPDHASAIELLTELHHATERLVQIDHTALALPDVARTMAQAVQAATGYDRVMVYRFLPDNSGEVVADERQDGMEAYLGLRYPEADIPKQARALYLASPMRSIHDASYQPAELRAAEGFSAASLDLGFATIRSVAPGHCDYLANMGVRASMSLSLVVGGRLWGLIACHHRTPKSMPIETWPLLRLMAEVASGRLAAMHEHGRFLDTVKGTQLTQLLTSRLNMTTSLCTALMQGSPNLLNLIDADGVVISYLGAVHRQGAAPATSEDHIRSALADRAQQTGKSVGDCLIQTQSGLGDGWDPELPGVLAIGFTDQADDYIAWYRRELTQTVRWAADPRKAVEVENGVPRLTPRGSYAAWEQSITGTSEAWQPREIESAGSIQKSLTDVVIRIHSLQEEVDRRTRDLQAFAYATSHDLRKPTQNISMRLSMLAEQLDQSSPEIKSSVEAALKGSLQLHDMIDGIDQVMQSTTGEFHSVPIDLNEVLTTVEELFAETIADQQVTIHRGALPIIEGDRGMILRVVGNLIDNAIKYRADEPPVIRVSAAYEQGVGGRIVVSDNGRGIDPDRVYEALHPFKRLTSDPAISGAGLGLAICQRIARRHGGRVFIDSVPGQGTTFTVTLTNS